MAQIFLSIDNKLFWYATPPPLPMEPLDPHSSQLSLTQPFKQIFKFFKIKFNKFLKHFYDFFWHFCLFRSPFYFLFVFILFVHHPFCLCIIHPVRASSILFVHHPFCSYIIHSVCASSILSCIIHSVCASSIPFVHHPFCSANFEKKIIFHT